MKPVNEGGSCVAIIMNGSPLFTGDAGSGESEIRRWILENDWLEGLIALPEQLFYNTGIATYVWVLTNRKCAERQGKVLLIDATSFWSPMRKSLGDKRREIPAEKAVEIVRLLKEFKEGEYCKIFPTTHFGYRKITIERPLRMNFQATSDRISRLEEQSAFKNLAVSKKKDARTRSREEAKGRAEQEAILAMVRTLPDTLFKNREALIEAMKAAEKRAGLKLKANIRSAIIDALSERDESAQLCRDTNGHPEPDPELRDTENVPLSESVEEFFEREVRPHVPDAWINTGIRDHMDGDVGKVGYEINFNGCFYKYTRPRPLHEIETDIRAAETAIVRMLAGITGTKPKKVVG